jgi:hypothetical protein
MHMIPSEHRLYESEHNPDDADDNSDEVIAVWLPYEVVNGRDRCRLGRR